MKRPERAVHGQSIGILILDTRFPRPRGDIGNAETWDFPVLYKKVRGATTARVVLSPDEGLLDPFLDAARELVEEGVEAITTSCGFLAMFQEELAKSVPVPVFTSSLMMAPMISRMLGPGKKVGIMTAHKGSLSGRHFSGAGMEGVPFVVAGMDGEEIFHKSILRGETDLWDYDEMIQAHRRVAGKFVSDNPDVGAILRECTNMPPFAWVVREETGLPVFDIVNLVNLVHASLSKRMFPNREYL